MGRRPGLCSPRSPPPHGLAYQAIFVDHQPIQTWTTGVCFICTDANLRPAKRKPSAKRVEALCMTVAESTCSRNWVAASGASVRMVSVTGAVLIDVGNGLLKAVNDAEKR